VAKSNLLMGPVLVGFSCAQCSRSGFVGSWCPQMSAAASGRILATSEGEAEADFGVEVVAGIAFGVKEDVLGWCEREIDMLAQRNRKAEAGCECELVDDASGV